MPRIAGVDIPADKRTLISLTYIFGIGKKSSEDILKIANVDENKKAKELSEDELSRIASIIDNNYTIEGQLKRQIRDNIERLKSIRCYRGIRHRMGLPVRGQQTQSNARTRKGPKKTVAGKKSVKRLGH